MEIIHFYSEGLEISGSEIVFYLECQQSKGAVVFKPGRGILIAYGFLDDTELYITKQDGKNAKEFLYNTKNDTGPIGTVGGGIFSLHGKYFNTHYSFKDIFKWKQQDDLIVKVFYVYTDIILNVAVNRSKKKWYLPIFNGEIQGKMYVKAGESREVILSVLMNLHYYIESTRNSD
ncbi:MAG: hypothetical protein QM791_04980 [Ferruginibacter sp.]